MSGSVSEAAREAEKAERQAQRKAKPKAFWKDERRVDDDEIFAGGHPPSAATAVGRERRRVGPRRGASRGAAVAIHKPVPTTSFVPNEVTSAATTVR